MPRRPKRPKRAQRANRPKWPDCPPPRVNLDDDEYVGKRDFANAREAKAVKRAVEQIVKDTWKQVGGLSRMILARAGGDITVRKAEDGRSELSWYPDSITLFVPPYDGSDVWRTAVHTLLGTGWALTFYWVQAIGLAGVREADEWPGRNPRDPANRWVEAFGQEEWDDEDWGFTAQLVTALLEISGVPSRSGTAYHATKSHRSVLPDESSPFASLRREATRPFRPVVNGRRGRVEVRVGSPACAAGRSVVDIFTPVLAAFGQSSQHVPVVSRRRSLTAPAPDPNSTTLTPTPCSPCRRR